MVQQVLGAYDTGFNRLMTHWRAHLGGRLIEVRYEDLVSDLGPEACRLIDRPALAWNDDCLTPEALKRPVGTLGMAQVRQKVHARSTDRWQAFEASPSPSRTCCGPRAFSRSLRGRSQT